ncbi:tetratricopeptide repeat protein [Chitinivibrio alkaliphilus]|uniref:Uncharacterized protein n=1 Tax=Chitinivibrio alkaliphilus ACht1 TaxID=1313304 RepID=U7D9Q1_9BACT|nr:tetratricopeptide repeat protein [Chitinivibrio alkaliphilus]ERP38752.1 hypothetical protein CALK_0771 [Chitinivibrio alkaliphilus ACht1]
MIFRLGIILVLLTSLLHGAQDPFSQGNSAYAQGEYRTAIDYYHQALMKEPYPLPNMYFNMGNAWFHLGNIGKSILAYERAQILAPGDTRIEKNLRHVRSLRLDRHERETSALDELRKMYYGFFPPRSQLKLLILLALIALICTICILFIPLKNKTAPLYGLGLALLLTLFFGSTTWYSLYRLRTHQRGVVTVSKASVRPAPQGTSEGFVLHEGSTFRILDQHNHWYRISFSDTHEGWIKKDNFEIIEHLYRTNQ